ncbi:MAG TPA: hypothetical protein VLV18_03785 [Terriglobales bacterium]|nr:hypothetical protein [Terriglobales bacterium]
MPPENSQRANSPDTEEHMLGHGYYNKNSHAQNQANAYALPLLVESVNEVELDRVSRCFQIADYGSAQGINSLLPLKTAIAELNSRTLKTQPRTAPILSVTHTDLPGNDWSSLFRTVLNSPDSYAYHQPNIFVSAAATSIYKQIFPPETISLGYSAISVHWLSRKPCNIPGHIWSARAKGEAHLKWSQQARSDWYAFLQNRASELIPSGQLVIIGSGAGSAGNSGAESIMDLVNEVLKGMTKDRVLRSEDLNEICVPTYYRTRREWEEPFTAAGFLQTGDMRLVKYDEVVMADTYLEQYEKTGDKAAFAKTYTSFLRAAFEPCLFVNLKRRRTASVSKSIIDQFWQRVENDVGRDPEKCSCQWVLALIRVAKAK